MILSGSHKPEKETKAGEGIRDAGSEDQRSVREVSLQGPTSLSHPSGRGTLQAEGTAGTCLQTFVFGNLGGQEVKWKEGRRVRGTDQRET